MLVEFRVKNFGCIKEEVKLSMVSKPNSNFAFETAHKKAQHILPAAGIFGPNASGKTTILDAIFVLIKLVIESTTFDKEQRILIRPFLLDHVSKTQPTELEIVFLHKENLYKYGIELSSERILEEWMYIYPKEGKENELFYRIYNDEKGEYNWKINDKLVKGPKAGWKDATQHNALFLSTVSRMNVSEHAPDLWNAYVWFKSYLDMTRSTSLKKYLSADLFYNTQKNNIGKEILNIMQTVGIDLNNIKVTEKEDDFFKNLPKDMPEHFINEFKYDIKFGHLDNNGEEVFFDFHSESEGTQMVFNVLGYLITTLNKGGTLIIDELHNHLHPFVLEKLISLFQDKNLNKNNAQLIFTSHDTMPMHPTIMGKDQIWFTQKRNDKSTELIPLSSFKDIRNESSFRNYYLEGKLGAIPNIKEIID